MNKTTAPQRLSENPFQKGEKIDGPRHLIHLWKKRWERLFSRVDALVQVIRCAHLRMAEKAARRVLLLNRTSESPLCSLRDSIRPGQCASWPNWNGKRWKNRIIAHTITFCARVHQFLRADHDCWNWNNCGMHFLHQNTPAQRMRGGFVYICAYKMCVHDVYMMCEWAKMRRPRHDCGQYILITLRQSNKLSSARHLHGTGLYCMLGWMQRGLNCNKTTVKIALFIFLSTFK